MNKNRRKYILAVVLTTAFFSLYGCSASKKQQVMTETQADTKEEVQTQAASEEVPEEAQTQAASEEVPEEVQTQAASEEVPEEAQTQAAAEEAAGEAVTEAVTEAVKETSMPEASENMGDVEVAGWHIVTENVQINQSLENISVALGYSGVQTSEFVKTAQDGCTFCLVKLLIEKQGSKEAIEWENMLLTDSEGNVYHRIEDEFILDLGMKRMAGTRLNFGSNEGWIAYEIPEDAAGLTISYAFENETYSCVLTET